MNKILRAVAPLRRWLGRLNPRDRQALRRGAWLLGPALLYVWAVKPVVADFRAAQDRLATERDLLSREAGLLAGAPQLPVQRATAESLFTESRSRLFPGADPVAAAAGLARYLTDQAGRHRVLVQGTETRDADPREPGLLSLVVEVRAIGDLAGITAWLAGLETGPKLVDVSELRIIPAARAGEDEVDEEVLGVFVRATGLTLAPVADTGAIALGDSP